MRCFGRPTGRDGRPIPARRAAASAEDAYNLIKLMRKQIQVSMFAAGASNLGELAGKLEKVA